MGDQFSLTLRNASPQPGLTFAIYTVIGHTGGTGSAVPMAWQAKRLNQGNNVTFTWTLDYSIMFSAQGASPDAVWSENGSICANDRSALANTIVLDFDGDYVLSQSQGAHPVRNGYLYLDTTAQVPSFTQADGPSIALGIATGTEGTPTPAVAANSGPNLTHTFDLHPTYYIQAGQLVQGQMADVNTVTSMQEVMFGPGVYDASWTLLADNTWSNSG